MPEKRISSHADFGEYLRQGEPGSSERAAAWMTAIGLQAVDGLRPSGYLVATACRHIEEDISIDEVRKLVDSYYHSQEGHRQAASGTEEADKVSVNIANLLGEKTFTFSPVGFLSLHRRIFDGVFAHAGRLRDYNITKKEWVLGGEETVLYTSASELEATLEYDFAQEKRFDFSGLTLVETIEHIVRFIAGLWQIHPFEEGNTRTTAVFAIKYLRYVGFTVGNEMFAEHAWFFRNALVRANYSNYQRGIKPDAEPLIRFFRNVLLGEQHDLHNRNLHVSGVFCTENEPVTAKGEQAQLGCFSLQGVEKECDGEKSEQVKLVSDSSQNSQNQRIEEKTEQARLGRRLLRMLRVMAQRELAVPELMKQLRLTSRQNFMKNWLNPAVQQGLACSLHPDTPHHPQQRYCLTEQGRRLLAQHVRL